MGPRLSARRERALIGTGVAAAALAIGLILFLTLATEGFYVPSMANPPTLPPGDHVLVLNGSSVARKS